MELTIIGTNHTKTRKAYQDEYGEVYLDCNTCGEKKKLEEFHADKGMKFYQKTSLCKPCAIAKVKKHYKENKEHSLEVRRIYRENNKEKVSEVQKIYREKNKEKAAEYAKAWREKNKEHNAEMARIYLENNRDRLLEYKKEWYQNNKEHMAELSAAWRESNKDRLAEAVRIWREKNKDRIAEMARKRYENNMEQEKERAREWRKANPERVAANSRKSKSIRRGLPVTLSSKDLTDLLAYQSGRCYLSGETDNLDLEHFIPVSWGVGGTTYENCYYMSRTLNSNKRSKNPFEWIKRQPQEYQDNFYNILVPELAARNEMSIEEFTEYVYQCEENAKEAKELVL